MTVMLNWPDPSFSEVSLALHVTVVVPTGNLSPDITTLPASSSHVMLPAGMAPSKASMADGNGDQGTTASAIPGSTFIIRTSSGAVTTGGSVSVNKRQQMRY